MEVQRVVEFIKISKNTSDNKLGFQNFKIKEVNAIGHYGGDKGFRSLLVMIPSERIGVVVLANSDYNEDFRQEIVYWLIDNILKHK